MKRKRYTIIKLFAGLVITYGIIAIYGTAGSSDLGLVTIEESALNCLIGVAAILTGILVIGFSEISKNNYKKKVKKNNERKRHLRKFIKDMALLEVGSL